MSQRELRGRHGRLPAAALPALCALLIAAVWLLGVGRQPMTFREMNKPYGQVKLEFQGWQKSFSTENGDSYGTVNGGPHLSLRPGTYRLSWVIETDAENTIRITSENGARIEPSEIAVPADTWTISEEFEVFEDARDVEFRIAFEAGTYLRVQDVSLTTPEYTDGTWTLTFLILLLGLLGWLALSGRMGAQRAEVLLLLGTAVLIVSAPALKPAVYMGDDAQFHILRIRNLADSLRAGQFPARVGGYTYMGYGAATSAFYPDLFCCFPALLMMTGASIAYAMNALYIAINAATALSMYLCGRRLLGGVWQGVCASALYTLASYRITDVYARGALGEALAMAALPVFLWGMYEVFFGDRRRWRLLVLGATCILQSHLLSTLICGLCAAAAGVVFLPRLVREKRLGTVLKAAAGTLLVNLFFLVPFAMLSGAQVYIPGGDAAKRAVSLGQLLLAQWQMFPGEYFTDMTLEPFPVEIGFPLLLGGVLGLRAGLLAQRGSPQRRRGLLLSGAGIAFALAATTLFPWAWLSELTRGRSDCIQFPWRLLTMADAMLALAGGLGLCALAEGRGRQAAVLALAAAAFAVLPYLNELTMTNRVLLSRETTFSDYRISDYTLPGTDLNRMTEQEPLASPGLAVTAYDKDGTRVTAHVDAQEDAELTLPLFDFDGYRAELDGERMEVGLGDNNRLTVRLPAGTSGTLRVRYAGRAVWHVCDGISLAALLALLAGAIRAGGRRRPERRDDPLT